MPPVALHEFHQARAALITINTAPPTQDATGSRLTAKKLKMGFSQFGKFNKFNT